MGTVSLQGRSILGLEDFKAEEIERVLDVAAQMKTPGRAVLLNLPASIWGRMLLILQRAAAQ